MYYGKISKELEELLVSYKNLFGYDPNGELGITYSANDTELYINDLKRCIVEGVDIGSLYPEENDNW